MKLLLLSTFLSASALLSAQSFEWNTSHSAPAAHPKEVQASEVKTYDGTLPEREQGVAGVYDASARGKQTAYGETYEATEMTGGHPALPLGTLLRVTNTENGRTVVVRVTDKGQECTDCLVTLSETAAARLGIAGRGAVSLERAGFSNWNPVPTGDTAASPATYGTTNDSTPKSAVEQPATFNRYAVARPAAAAVRVDPPTPTVPEQQAARGASAPRPAAIAATPAPASGTYAVQLAAYNNETYALRRVEELKEQGINDVYYRAITKPDGEVINRVYAGAFVNVTEAQAAAKTIQGKFNIAGIVAKM
ncbi:Endolytic peptidoglycan transglycosylase RlpA [Neolewinella maritima]|uniref:Endolytic peptidoglycan transglycosylase RlpA n=1 Tax=Neolewinella maritima TaxID=1383882 RepID=A0ABN8F039_9BACT|nr:RlpA-like double-psi beta-barrel domain-containing protein [Neolewinella maritima]CAH0999636.1 Endolytic peptidoglycan transglycosylase RlpA [Neolewinella maritima]